MIDRPDYETPTQSNLAKSHDYGLLQRLYNQPAVKKPATGKKFFLKRVFN